MITTEHLIGFTVGCIVMTIVYLRVQHIKKIDTFKEGQFKKGGKRARLYGRLGGLTKGSNARKKRK